MNLSQNTSNNEDLFKLKEKNNKLCKPERRKTNELKEIGAKC
jgi:hypothetical protein